MSEFRKGMACEMVPFEDIVSRTIEGTGGLTFGVPVQVGTDQEKQVKAWASGGRLFGFTLFDGRKGTGPDDAGTVVRFYAEKIAGAVMRKGRIWVEAGATIVAGGQLALLKTATSFPTTTTTLAEASSGTDPAFGTEDDLVIAYSILGPWGESALKGASAATDVSGYTNYIEVTVPGQDALPKGTTYLQLWASTDGGTTFAPLTDHKIAWADITDAATHVEDLKGADDDVGATEPEAADPTLLAVGAVLPTTDTRDITTFSGTEFLSGAAKGELVKLELNLPA